MKKFMIVFLSILLLIPFSFASEKSFDIGKLHTSNDLYKSARSLVERFPGILAMETIGESVDGRPIYVIKLTQDVKHVDQTYVSKMHHLVEAGIHARENMGPNAVLAMIEDYCIDVYNNDHIAGIDVKAMLGKHVFHFIPLSNPDGYDLALFGLGKMMKFSTVDYLNHIEDQAFSNYKSNVHGVDLNRNFPGLYYHTGDNQWYDIWSVQQNQYRSSIPSGAYYFGEESASEPETKVLMKYAMSYDFRDYISFHSKGQVVFWDHWMLPRDFRDMAYNYGKLVANSTGYMQMPTDNLYSTSSGYYTDYTAMNSLKPSLTIEILPYGTNLPAKTSLFDNEYKKMYKSPLAVALYSEKVGYYPYRLYINGRYIRDFINKEYAEAFAQKVGGYILEDDGLPLLWYYEETIKDLRNFHLLDLHMIK